MAQPRAHRRENNYSDFTPYPQTCQQTQFGFEYFPQYPETYSQFSAVPQRQSMPQPDQSHIQAWQVLTPPSESKSSPTSNTVDYTAAYTHWGGMSMYGYGLPLDNSAAVEPLMMSASERNLYANNDLFYNHLYAQDATGMGISQLSGHASWAVPGPIRNPYNTSVSSSDLGSSSSFSPKSYTSDNISVEVPVATPELTMDVASASNYWAGGGSSYYQAIKTSPSTKALSTPQMNSPPVSLSKDVTSASITNVPAAMSLSSSDMPDMSFNTLPVSPEGSKQLGYGQTHSQNSISEASWFPQSKTVSTLSSVPGNQVAIPSLGSASSGYVSNTDIPHIPLARSNNCEGVTTQAELQGRFHVPQQFGGKVQRDSDDEILLRGKRDGLTYKEIIKKMHTKCAESTLRGRYRSLTKAKRDRVRKPVWREVDVKLLKRYVRQDLERIEAHYPLLSSEQRLSKVQWRKAADYIESNGGTYHFGNSTCKRKWLELYPGRG